jgi:hypothetical protein
MKRSRHALVFAVLAAAGCNFRLVGGVCAEGFVERDGACYAEDDVADGGAGEGAAGAGGSDDGGSNEGGFGAQAGGGESPTGGSPAGGGGQGGGGPDCEPLAACGNECVDLDSDPLNCGSCGHICQTALCGGGQCQGASAGHVAAIGIDYGAVNPGSSAARLLGNAVFLHAHEPVRVSLYAQDASVEVRTKVSAIVNAEAAARGRSALIVNAMDPAPLGDAAAALDTDVVVVLPQPFAEIGEMADIANAWAQPFQDFIGSGGVLVVLAEGDATQELLSTSLWLGPLQLGALPLQSLQISSWLDALSVGVLSPFALSHAATSITPSAPLDAWTQVVVSTSADEPVVLHRVVAPGP